MKCLTKAFSLILATVLLVFALGTTVWAAPSKTYRINDPKENNREVETLAAALEEKYGIAILYPTVTGEDSQQLATIFPAMLATLDEALSTVTPALVRQVSAYYYRQTGRRITYSYTYADLRGPYGFGGGNEVQVGGFNRQNARIELFIPQQEGQAIATGDNPLTIVHEFAHAVHFMLADQYGYVRMEREWLALMEGHGFAPDYVDGSVFITPYASSEFDEDFAETFAHVYICNRPGLGFSHRLGTREQPTALGRKVEYIEKLLGQYLSENQELLENYRKIYETPISTSQSGLRLSGTHLLFIDMEEPRTIPLLLLNNLYVSERNTVWFASIGGWYCQDIFGNHLVLFPEGTYGNPGRDLVAYQAEQDAKAAAEQNKIA